MRARAIALASFPIALAVCAAWLFSVHGTPVPISPAPDTIVVAGNSIAVELATTSAARAQGLSDRSNLAPNSGMLFVFPRDGDYAFWMKDMRFAIDIVWLDAHGTIVTIRESITPGTYPHAFTSASAARYVLELPAGYAAAHGLREGDSVAGLSTVAGQSE